ncbi:MAG: histidine--tRNA ligase [Deltaproteobacteria bacterium]|nr:histidine--tRNA ligase [Deltaproteobacteria bacterium]
MSKQSTKPPSGTRDFLPRDIARRRHVIGVIERVYASYGFVPIETPSYENLSTLLGKYGEEGDQLLFRLLKRRDALARVLTAGDPQEADLADLGLRYDLTVPLARVVAQYRDLPRFFKRYQIQPVWRADRPGRGRFREFYQCDVDMIGSESLIAESEVLAAVCQVVENLGFDDFTVQVNHRQLLRSMILAAGIALDAEQSALVALDKLDKVGAEGVLAELAERGIAPDAAQTLLELSRPAEADGPPLAALDRLADQLNDDDGQQAIRDLRELNTLCQATVAGRYLRFSPQLARGLSYYTGPIFELNVAQLAGSIGGGGRYDNLVGMFSNQPIPAVGCSLGLERLLLLMDERDLYPELQISAQVIVCNAGAQAEDLLLIAQTLRQAGLRVEVYPNPQVKLGKQLQYADSAAVGIPIAAIVGKDELASGQLTLKNLASGEQQTLPLSEAATQVSVWLS